MSNRGIVGGAVIDGTDFKLPAIVTGYGDGTNAVTSSDFAVLPTTTCSASMTNPHPHARLLVITIFGAWMNGDGSTTRVTGGLAVSGSLTGIAGIGGSGPIGWGEIPMSYSSSTNQHQGMATWELPVSGTAATWAWHAFREGSGSVACNYPTIRVIPLRYIYDQGRTG